MASAAKKSANNETSEETETSEESGIETLFSSASDSFSFGDVLTGDDGNKYAVISAYLAGNLIEYDSSKTLNNGLSDDQNAKLEKFSEDADFVKDYLAEGKIKEYVQLYKISNPDTDGKDRFPIINADGKIVAQYAQKLEADKATYEINLYNSDITKRRFISKRFKRANEVVDFDFKTQRSMQKVYKQIGNEQKSTYLFKEIFDENNGDSKSVEYVLSNPDPDKYGKYTIKHYKDGHVSIIAKSCPTKDKKEERCNRINITTLKDMLTIMVMLYAEGTPANLGTDKLFTEETTKYIEIRVPIKLGENNPVDVIELPVDAVYVGAYYDENKFPPVKSSESVNNLTFKDAIDRYLKDYIKISGKKMLVEINGQSYHVPVLVARANFDKSCKEFYNKDFLDVELTPYSYNGNITYRSSKDYDKLEKVSLWGDDNDTLPNGVKKYIEVFEQVCNGTYNVTSSNF